MSVDRAILTSEIATPHQRERLRDAALGGALTQSRLLKMVITILALSSTYALLVFRESAAVNTLEAGRVHPPGFTVVAPAAITWRTVDLPEGSGLPTTIAFDAARSEFQLPLDSGEFVRIKAKTGAMSHQAMPFVPGPDIPVVLQPTLTRNFWPGTDGKRSFFLTADNTLVTVDARTLKVLESSPALPSEGAPRRFSTDYPFWHVAFNASTDRLVIVVRDRTEGQVLSFFQFDEPKRGFGTLQYFAVDGATGTVSYSIDDVPHLRQLQVSESGALANESITLPQAPFPAGSTAPSEVWGLPVRRLAQLAFGEVSALAQVQGGPTVALRHETPMVLMVAPGADTQPAGYFPNFAAMPANGILPTKQGVVLLGSQEAQGEIVPLGIEVLDLTQRTVARPAQFESGAIRIPQSVAELPLAATSPDGQYVAIAGPHATQVWIATIAPITAEAVPAEITAEVE